MQELPTQNHWVRALVVSGKNLYSGSYQAIKVKNLALSFSLSFVQPSYQHTLILNTTIIYIYIYYIYHWCIYIYIYTTGVYIYIYTTVIYIYFFIYIYHWCIYIYTTGVYPQFLFWLKLLLGRV